MHISDGSIQEEKPSVKMASPKVVRYLLHSQYLANCFLYSPSNFDNKYTVLLVMYYTLTSIERN